MHWKQQNGADFCDRNKMYRIFAIQKSSESECKTLWNPTIYTIFFQKPGTIGAKICRLKICRSLTNKFGRNSWLLFATFEQGDKTMHRRDQQWSALWQNPDTEKTLKNIFFDETKRWYIIYHSIFLFITNKKVMRMK